MKLGPIKALLLCGVTTSAVAAPRVRSVLELQPYRKTIEATVDAGAGKGTRLYFVQPNKFQEAWYLLDVRWARDPELERYHLENPEPNKRKVRLRTEGELALEITDERGRHTCKPWEGGAASSELARARRAAVPFATVCGGALYLRNPTRGDHTTEEWAVQFLRDRVKGGEDVIDLMKDTLYQDHALISSEVVSDASGAIAAGRGDDPVPALLAPQYQGTRVQTRELSLRVHGGKEGTLRVGQWHAAKSVRGVFVSAFMPDAVPPKILASYVDRANPLDQVEKRALAYLVAFDLSRFDPNYAVGTENPEVKYSDRATGGQRVRGWPGPDGVGSFSPFVATGLVSPHDAQRVAAVFTGGFKRKHSIFRVGALAARNGGTHYGFLMDGVVFSKLWPGLATAVIGRDGAFTLKTWSKADDETLPDVRFARQNGLPLVEWDAEKNAPRPGHLVHDNYAGNWSGNKDGSIRTLRSGLCWQRAAGAEEHPGYLIYGYFSAHSPSAMARVFQAYGCRHAMHLDMNMMRHVYMALHSIGSDGAWRSEHLLYGMRARDMFVGSKHLPRFVGAPDNRDFFYMTNREASGAKDQKLSQARKKRALHAIAAPQTTFPALNVKAVAGEHVLRILGLELTLPW